MSFGAGGSTGVPSPAQRGSPSIPQNLLSTPPPLPIAPRTTSSSRPISPASSDGQASIIAYNKLYSGTPAATAFCGTATPAVYWSYNTNFNAAGAATTGTIATSPILSGDGTKVAFIENNGGAGAVLHLLKWNAGDGGAISTAINPTTQPRGQPALPPAPA